MNQAQTKNRPLSRDRVTRPLEHQSSIRTDCNLEQLTGPVLVMELWTLQWTLQWTTVDSVDWVEEQKTLLLVFWEGEEETTRRVLTLPQGVELESSIVFGEDRG